MRHDPEQVWKKTRKEKTRETNAGTLLHTAHLFSSCERKSWKKIVLRVLDEEEEEREEGGEEEEEISN